MFRQQCELAVRNPLLEGGIDFADDEMVSHPGSAILFGRQCELAARNPLPEGGIDFADVETVSNPAG